VTKIKKELNLRFIPFICFLLACFVFPVLQVSASSQSNLSDSANSVTVPAFEITVPVTLEYLGLAGEEHFKSNQIKAEIIIIEMFSMYCPHCQREAPLVNELYNAIEKNAAFKDKIKLIGIGAGNSCYEVDVFRKKYEVPFPLFPDKSFAITKILKVTETPTFVGLKVKKDKDHNQFMFHVAGFENVSQFLKKIEKLSELKTEGR